MIKQYTTTKAELLFVEVPNGRFAPKISPKNLSLFYEDSKSDTVINLPPGNWQIAGKLDEITEEQAAALVDSKTANNVIYHKHYTLYSEWPFLRDPKMSIRSLSQHLGFTPEQNVIVLFNPKK